MATNNNEYFDPFLAVDARGAVNPLVEEKQNQELINSGKSPEVSISTTPTEFDPFANVKEVKQEPVLFESETMSPKPIQTALDWIEQGKKADRERLIGAGFGLTQAARGAKQLYLDMFADEKTARDYQNYITEEARVFRGSEVGQSVNAKIGEFAGGALPFMVIPAGPAGAGVSGLLLRTGYSSAVGGVTAALQPVETGDSRVKKIQAGLLLGIAGETANTLVKRGSKYLANRILREQIDTPAYKEGQNIIEGIKESSGIDVDFDLYQMSQSPSALAATKAAGKDLKLADQLYAQQNKDIENLGKFWNKTIDKFTKAKAIDEEELVPQVRKAYDTFVTTLKDQRKANWNNLMSQASAQSKDAKIITTDNTRRTIMDVLDSIPQDAPEELLPIRRRAQEELAKLTNKSKLVIQGKGNYDDILNSKRLLTVKEMQQELATYGTLGFPKTMPTSLSGQEKVKFYQKLWRGLKDDLDVAAAGDSPASKLLAKARDKYKIDSNKIDGFELSTVGKLLGKDPKTITIEDVADKLKKLKPTQVGVLSHTLKSVDMDLYNKSRAFTLKEAWEDSTRSLSPEGIPNVDIKKFWQKAPDAKKLSAMGFTKPEIDELHLAVRAAGRLANSIQANSHNLVELAQNAAGIGMSWDRTFIGILAAKSLAPNLYKNLATSEGRKAILQASKTTSPVQFISAMSILLDKADDIFLVDPKQKEASVKLQKEFNGRMQSQGITER